MRSAVRTASLARSDKDATYGGTRRREGERQNIPCAGSARARGVDTESGEGVPVG